MDKARSQERKEADLLNGKNGFTIETKLFGRKKIWKVTRFTLGLMDKQSRLYHKLKVDYTGDSVSRMVGRSVSDNAKVAAEIIAISVLGTKWKIFFFRKVLKRHFFWQVDSAKLLEFTNNLFLANNYKDFMTSIALMSVNTVTAPARTTPEADPIEGYGVPME